MPRTRAPERSRAEVTAILRRLERSGKSQRAFSEDEGISASTLAFWVRRECLEGRDEPQDAPLGRTTLVALAGEPVRSSDSFEVELGDVVIRLPRDVSAREWRRLRKAWGS